MGFQVNWDDVVMPHNRPSPSISTGIWCTCSGTVALLVWRWARVRRSTMIRTPLESITSFTFFYDKENAEQIK
jgi:hypothetical protein